MIIVKGFVTVNELLTNAPGQTSVIGELSTFSRTYSREKGEYQNNELQDFKLITFKSIDSQTNQAVVVPDSLVKQILLVVYESLAYAKRNIRPYDSFDFKNSMLANFFQKVTDLHIGNFVDNGTVALPEWIGWTSADNDGAFVKIWLSDLAFQNQYDESEIVVIPPLDIVDHFFKNYNVAMTEIRERTMTLLSDKIQEVKGENPETYLRLLDFDFHNFISLDQKNSTTWAVLIYGKVGDNIDAIKDALVEYILANSQHNKLEWETILPNIFKRTEFVLLPRWDKISVQNLTDLSSLYSSVVNPIECVDFAKKAIDFYPASFIEANIELFPYDYKALTVIAVNGEGNIEGNRSLVEIFPDYIPVPSTSADFNRMVKKTRDWTLFIEKLLMTAEVATEFSGIPHYAHKQYRGGKLYISGMFDNVNYLVAARMNSYYQV